MLLCFCWRGGSFAASFFLSKNSKTAEKLRKIEHKNTANDKKLLQNLSNYLIYNKIKFLFFLLKSVAIIKKVVYLQCQTTTKQTTKTKNNYGKHSSNKISQRFEQG